VLALAGCQTDPLEPEAVSLETTVLRSTWQSAAGPGQILRSKHYRIFTTSQKQALLGIMPGFMEAAYDHYLSLTGLPANNGTGPLDLYVLANREQWASLTKHRLGDRSGVYLQLEAGGYMLDGVCVLWDLGSAIPTMSVASHEGLHQFLHHRLTQRIPMWAEEGLCATAEGFDLHNGAVRFTPATNPSRFSSLRNVLVQGYWIPIDKLLPMDAGDAIGQHRGKAVGYYAQVWSLILFIQQNDTYRNGFQQMLRDAQEGRLVSVMGLTEAGMGAPRGRRYNRIISDPAFRHYVAADTVTFEKQWHAFATSLAGLSQ
jgi:hypothetical protein